MGIWPKFTVLSISWLQIVIGGWFRARLKRNSKVFLKKYRKIEMHWESGTEYLYMGKRMGVNGAALGGIAVWTFSFPHEFVIVMIL